MVDAATDVEADAKDDTSSPRLAAGPQGFAVLFSSIVQGSDLLNLRLMP